MVVKRLSTGVSYAARNHARFGAAPGGLHEEIGMSRHHARAVALLFVIAGLVGPARASAQLSSSATAAAELSIQYRIVPNVTYYTANGWDNKLDIYQPRNVTTANPTLIWIHGGGWVLGSKDTALFSFLPFLEKGWTVVNVEYRLGKMSPPPAAVEDCRCALRWVYQHAKEYNFDTSRLVVSGSSVGGHLSLTTGILPVSAGFDRPCPAYGQAGGITDPSVLKVSAIINWYGVTDVADLFDGPNHQLYAVEWFGSMASPAREELAKRLSPLTYVRAGLPPILTIHGTDDPQVPYSHGVRLHEALAKAGVPNQLLTIPGGKHGGFTREETLKIWATIDEFLKKQVGVKSSSQ